MTQTKEEILEANYQEFYDATQPGHRYPLWVADEPYVHKAMDLYAEQLTAKKYDEGYADGRNGLHNEDLQRRITELEQLTRQKDERIAELEMCLANLYNGLKSETSTLGPVKRSIYVTTQMAKAKKVLNKK
jgi:hypothetical protein